MPTLNDFFESAELPVMSEVAHALVRTLSDGSASGAQVEAIVAKDPALTANLLRMANCAQFGLSRQVTSLKHAITLLGMARIRSLALSTSIKAAFPVVAGLDRAVFWNFSMACAGYAHWLADPLGLDPQEAWLAGMMLRLGELLIGQRSPASLAEIEAQGNPAQARWMIEQRLLGFDETQLTAALARHWNFPSAIVDGLQSAGEPMSAQPFNVLAGVLHLAARLADGTEPHADVLATLPAPVIAALGLDQAWMAAKLPPSGSFVDVSEL